MVVVMAVALKVIVEICLTNKYIDSLMLLVTFSILTELRFNMKEIPTICGRRVGNVNCSTGRDHSVCPLARQYYEGILFLLVFGRLNASSYRRCWK